MTPFEISVLMHYHTRRGDFRNGDFSAPILAETFAAFVKAGVLRRTEPGSAQQYEPTDATRVYVDALCAVPLPVQRWVVPESRTAGDGGRE